ncbi:glycosyltransferase family 2 protein [Verrucomicrobiaceae bacterium 5K15]|uniref:Glycosyltransferase family 2 protein n=1 Tax=Oceaniferula flava TaxID=2800421 RepID=A0AAE2SB86_9BACT|nr:glycosyltransferase family A protein [Oceaniferula flavus]MBK1854945.1 glycosyltransferase family 2 protein [Oceaniferula flavus]MBM1136251.1 glycosyltransferase family 2 protein [Oceaniferula flavus]
MTDNAVIFIIYARADHTERVFSHIRAAHPRHLYVIADGPKPGSDSDYAACDAARAVIQVDWQCELTLDYSEENLGCQRRIHSGISKAFEQFDRAIILEDDCLPHPDFFTFCDLMLERYQDDAEVMHICGSNFVHPKHFKRSYAFNQYATPWGWATWKRAWQHIDLNMTGFLEQSASIERRMQISPKAFAKLSSRLHKVQSGEVCSWAYPWLSSILALDGLCITPQQNLISNIGFGERSTHTSDPDSPFANKATSELPDELSHPDQVALDRRVQREIFDFFFGGKHRKRGVLGWPRKIKRAWRKWKNRGNA